MSCSAIPHVLIYSSSQGIRNTVNDYLLSFGGYDWLWKDDKDGAYDDFMAKNPSLDDYEAKLKTFSTMESEIGEKGTEQGFILGTLDNS